MCIDLLLGSKRSLLEVCPAKDPRGFFFFCRFKSFAPRFRKGNQGQLMNASCEGNFSKLLGIT